MLGVLLYLLVFLLAQKLHKTRSRVRKPRGVCGSCVFAHIQYSPKGRIATFCTYGLVVRPVAIEVVYCTDYRDRSVPLRIIPIGFVLPASEPELAAAAASNETVANA